MRDGVHLNTMVHANTSKDKRMYMYTFIFLPEVFSTHARSIDWHFPTNSVICKCISDGNFHLLMCAYVLLCFGLLLSSVVRSCWTVIILESFMILS